MHNVSEFLINRTGVCSFETASGYTFEVDLSEALTGAWVTAKAPGTQSVQELNTIIQLLSSTGGGSLLFPPSSTPYSYDGEILLENVNNVSVILSPGVVITRPNEFTLNCKIESGSKIVSVLNGDTSKLKTGYYAAQYVTGSGIPVATRINSKYPDGVRFELDKNATSTLEVTLTFHYAHNIIRRQNSNGVRIIAPWGRATLDANGVSSPFTFDSEDALRNCIRTAACKDIETSGLLLKNAHYHGEIGVTNSGKIRLVNIFTENNGFRGIHYHGDSFATAGGVVGTISDIFADELDSYKDGHKAWRVLNDRSSTGIFIVYDNTARVQVGRVRITRCPGIGFHMTGTVTAGVRACDVTVSSIVCKDVGTPVALMKGLKSVHIETIKATGDLFTLTNAVLGTGVQALPLWNDASGYVPNAVMSSITVPAGFDMNSFDIGHAVYVQDVAAGVDEASGAITSGLDKQLTVWSVDIPNRKLFVYNYNTPASRPWGISSDGTTTTATVWTSRGPGLYLDGNTGADAIEDISVSSASFTAIGGKTITILNRGVGVRSVLGFAINKLIQRDCYAGAYLYNGSDVSIGSLSSSNSGNRRTGNDTFNVGALYMQHCVNVTVGSAVAVSKGSASMTRNGAAEVHFDSQCNNVKLLNVVVSNQNSSTTALQATGTNMLLGDPRLDTGTTFTPFTTGGTNVSVFRYGLT